MTLNVDLVICGGKVVLSDESAQASIAIKDGRIVAIGEDRFMPRADRKLDVKGLHVLPGAIDVHVHFRDPGSLYKETWETGSAAAAAGGVTTVFDMPNTDPATSNLTGLSAKRKRAAALSHVNWGLYAVLDESSLPHIDQLAAAGVVGFKCFMTETTGDLPSPDDGLIFEGLERLARYGLRCSVHAENTAILMRRRAYLIRQGRTDAAAHLESRPDVCEIEALGRAIALAEAAGAPLHMAHHSSAGGVEVARRAKARGVNITGETCPHYLFFNETDVARLGGQLRINPPIRTARDSEEIWKGLLDGTIDMIATDHAPHTAEEKMAQNIWTCCRGVTGIETQMAVMLTEVQRGRMSVHDYVNWSATNPAKVWGLFPQKGVIAVGSDADLAIVDIGVEDHIDQTLLHSLNRISPWHGRFITARPRHTVVRGRVVFEDGKVTGSPGWGTEVRRCDPRDADERFPKVA